jgi:protocatechuate 3,4-dioxygenase beta subunit
MRVRLIVVAVLLLLGGGLVLLRSGRPGAPAVSEGNAGTAPREAPSSPVPPRTPSEERADTPPPLAPPPGEEDGILEVEVLAGERPWPGATVRLYRPPERGVPAGESAWRLAGSGVTDAEGRVRLASRPGGYLVAVRAQGHAPLLRDVVRPQGEARTVLRVLLERGYSLTGRTVVHGTGEPLPLVELVLTAHARELQAWQRAEAPDEERVYATSDARGNFRVDGLAPGTWLLEARAPGHARAERSHLKIPQEGPLTVELRVAGVIEGFVVDARGRLAADAEVRVDGSPDLAVTTGAEGSFSIEVEPGAHTLSARRGEEAGALDRPLVLTPGSTVRDVRIPLGAGAVLEGRVLERSSGGPVAGGRVEVSLSEEGGDAGQALTDAEGRFTVRGLAPGSYDARVRAQGYSPTVRRGLTVAPGERFPVEFLLTRTGTVEGQVRDGAGQPVVDARVTGERWNDGAEAAPIQARTDATGHYRLEGLATGRLYLIARREGSTVGVRQTVDVEERGTSRADFTLEGTGTVEGVVRTRRRLPDEALEVTAMSEGTTGGGLPEVGRVGVGAAGDFRMVLPPGGYTLLLSARDRATLGAHKQVRVEEGRTVRVELAWEEERDGSEYRGVVLEPDGTPSPGAMVTLTVAEGRQFPLMMEPADEEGRFVLRLPAAAGTSMRRVVLSAHNGGRASEPLPVKPGQEVVVRLRPSASLRGRVVREGEPVRGFTLMLQLQKGHFSQGPWEFPGERFELRDVPAEPVRLVARTAGGESGEVRVSPGAGATLEVDIPLRATATVRGRVVDAATKAPMPEAFVFIEGEPSMAPENGPGADGRFSLAGVRAGERLLVVLGGSSHKRVTRTVKLEEGQVLDVGDIALEAVSASPSPAPR